MNDRHQVSKYVEWIQLLSVVSDDNSTSIKFKLSCDEDDKIWEYVVLNLPTHNKTSEKNAEEQPTTENDITNTELEDEPVGHNLTQNELSNDVMGDSNTSPLQLRATGTEENNDEESDSNMDDAPQVSAEKHNDKRSSNSGAITKQKTVSSIRAQPKKTQSKASSSSSTVKKPSKKTSREDDDSEERENLKKRSRKHTSTLENFKFEQEIKKSNNNFIDVNCYGKYFSNNKLNLQS